MSCILSLLLILRLNLTTMANLSESFGLKIITSNKVIAMNKLNALTTIIFGKVILVYEIIFDDKLNRFIKFTKLWVTFSKNRPGVEIIPGTWAIRPLYLHLSLSVATSMAPIPSRKSLRPVLTKSQPIDNIREIIYSYWFR